MDIEELAFKDRKTLEQLNKKDLLDIIEFVQLDRKLWINQFSKTHNDSVDIRKENLKLKLELSGYRQAILNNKEMLGLKEQNDKLKKQLEDMTLCRDIASGHREEVQDREVILLNQQKEFIKYLEDEIKEVEKTIELLSDTRDSRIPILKYKKHILEVILAKYKEITQTE